MPNGCLPLSVTDHILLLGRLLQAITSWSMPHGRMPLASTNQSMPKGRLPLSVLKKSEYAAWTLATFHLTHETNASNWGKAWSFWGGTHFKATSATRGAKLKKLHSVELKLAPYNRLLDRWSIHSSRLVVSYLKVDCRLLVTFVTWAGRSSLHGFLLTIISNPVKWWSQMKGGAGGLHHGCTPHLQLNTTNFSNKLPMTWKIKWEDFYPILLGFQRV